jgi:hypothetical protein
MKVKMKIKLTLRLAVYRQLVRLGAKPLEDHDQRFFGTESLRSLSMCNILCDEKLGLSFMNGLGLFHVYISHRSRSHFIENSSLCIIYKLYQLKSAY